MASKSNAKYLFITLLLILCLIALLLYLKGRQQPPLTQPQQPETKAPSAPVAFDYMPAPLAGLQIIGHSHFTLAYSETHEQAAWVAYELTREEVEGSTERTDDFREDPKVTTGSATPNDYRRSGYDRGHLAPAGDMGFSQQAMSESFYMSNMSPQAPAFNRGIWKDLEEKVRRWAVADERLYVVTGPVFAGSTKKIGKNEVTVPAQFYKILLDYQGTESDARMIAFLMPNEGSSQTLQTFVVSVDSVEVLTGIDFFPALPDSLENALEAEISLRGWFE